MQSIVVDILRLAVWLALLTAIFVPLERLFAVRPQRIWRTQAVVDLAYYWLNSLGTAAIIALPMAALAAGLHRLLPSAMLSLCANLPFWPRLAAAIVVGEVGFYWGHRWSHTWPLLWRFHAVHHSAEQLDFMSNIRAHPIDLMFTRICGFVPIYAVGLAGHAAGSASSTVIPALVAIIGTVWGYFIHANLRWRFGPLESLVATPAFHHWHHTNDAFRDHNYASMIPLFDHLFGTYHVPKAWPPCYGIDAPMSPSLGRQLIQPLSFRRTGAAELVQVLD